MADPSEDQARTKDSVGVSSSPGPTACTLGAEATFQIESERPGTSSPVQSCGTPERGRGAEVAGHSISGSPEATSQPEAAEAIPGFREACLDVLHLLSYPAAGSWDVDEADICARLSKLKGSGRGRRALSGMYRLAVALYAAAVRGQRGATKEFLDRCEGAVVQRHTLTVTPEQAARMSDTELGEMLAKYGIAPAAQVLN